MSELIQSSGERQLLLSDFAIEEDLQLGRRALLPPCALHSKHLEHGVDPLQGQLPQIGEHTHDVGPEHLCQREK